MASKILVVDDEQNIVKMISYNLQKEGYDVLEAFDGKAGLELALTKQPEVILLDIMMPEMDGFEVCKKIREKSQVPIIMLTARAEELDKVLGLELGADDYVTKPFSIRELLARVKANIRRSQINEERIEESSELSFGQIMIDTDKFEVKRKGEIIELTRREFDLLKFLATQNNMIFSRETLLSEVWGYEYYGDIRAVDVTIRRLRTKIEYMAEEPVFIITKRGVGYYFNIDNDKEV